MPINLPRMLCSSAAGNDNNSPSLFQPPDKAITVIALIRDHIFLPQIEGFQQFLRIADIIAVACGQHKPQGVSKAVHYRVHLCAQSSPTASEGFIAPFLAPLPCWCTLIVVLSNIRALSSTMSSQKYAPTRPAYSTGEIGCTHFSMSHTAPANHAREYPCLTNIESHLAFAGYFFPVGLHAEAFRVAEVLVVYSIAYLLFHVVSYPYSTIRSFFVYRLKTPSRVYLKIVNLHKRAAARVASMGCSLAV